LQKQLNICKEVAEATSVVTQFRSLYSSRTLDEIGAGDDESRDEDH